MGEWVCVVRWLSANGYDLGLGWERKELHRGMFFPLSFANDDSEQIPVMGASD
jgi:hypothetical protein